MIFSKSTRTDGDFKIWNTLKIGMIDFGLPIFIVESSKLVPCFVAASFFCFGEDWKNDTAESSS